MLVGGYSECEVSLFYAFLSRSFSDLTSQMIPTLLLILSLKDISILKLSNYPMFILRGKWLCQHFPLAWIRLDPKTSGDTVTWCKHINFPYLRKFTGNAIEDMRRALFIDTAHIKMSSRDFCFYKKLHMVNFLLICAD